MRMCKDCSEPMEDQTSRKRICNSCKLDREIEKQEREESRRKAD